MKYSQSDGKPAKLQTCKYRNKSTRMQSFSYPEKKFKNPLLSNLLRPFLLGRIKNSAKNLQNQKICVHLHPLSEKAIALVR